VDASGSVQSGCLHWMSSSRSWILDRITELVVRWEWSVVVSDWFKESRMASLSRVRVVLVGVLLASGFQISVHGGAEDENGLNSHHSHRLNLSAIQEVTHNCSAYCTDQVQVRRMLDPRQFLRAEVNWLKGSLGFPSSDWEMEYVVLFYVLILFPL